MSLSHQWIAAPQLQRTYLALVAPGGSAVEHHVGAPPGTSHLLEHLFYRQNELDGHPLDQLGGSVGLLTTAETQHIIAAVDPEDGPRVAQWFARWYSEPRFPADIVASEREVVIDEVAQANRSPTRVLWNLLMAALAPASHLARDFGGQAEELRALPLARLAELQQRIARAGGAQVALGPRSPWQTEAVKAPVWQPARSEPPRNPQRMVRRVRGIGHCVIGSAQMLAGPASREFAGSYARYASLAFGRLHPSQRRFHLELNLRYLQLELRVHRDAVVLAAFARCPPALADTVAELTEALVASPGDAGTPARLHRCAVHGLLTLRDDPERRVLDEATRALYGIESLESEILRLCATSADELADTAVRAARGATATVMLVEED
jgi:Insulinase (Peptidase family M16)